MGKNKGDKPKPKAEGYIPKAGPKSGGTKGKIKKAQAKKAQAIDAKEERRIWAEVKAKQAEAEVHKAFNRLTEQSKPDGLLWVADNSIGGRYVRYIGEFDEAVLDEVEDYNDSYCLGYNPEMVTEVEFISATSKSILRWTRNGYGLFEGRYHLSSDEGVLEYQEGAPGYQGAYYKAFMEALA